MTRRHSAGKGDTPRKLSISKEEYDKRYEQIFGSKDKRRSKPNKKAGDK